MGRAKPKMELISKEKSRNITFKKRKEGLIRKLHEFTTLCDVSACMIIYGPRQENGAVEPEIWPQNANEVNRIIDIYKARNKDSGSKTYGLSDFFHDRKRKIEEELVKMRKKNMEAKYPTWPEFMDFMTEAQLREFSAVLSIKADYVKSRIEFLRRYKLGFHFDPNLMDFSHVSLYPPGERGMELIKQQTVHFPTIDHSQELHFMNQNNSSMRMLLKNDNDNFVQFGGASTSGNIQSAPSSLARQNLYEPIASGCGMVEPTISHGMTEALPQYYMPPVPLSSILPSPSYMMPVVPPPLLQLTEKENNDGGQVEMIDQFSLMNHKTWF